MASNRPGRPPIDPADPSVAVHVRVPGKLYDRSYAAARVARLSVPAWIRRTLEDATTPPRRPASARPKP